MTITDYYVTTDAMGSVTAILDDEGNILERRCYDAFGEMTCMTPEGTPVAESPTSVDVGFQGQIRDEVSGLYQMGYRWYNQALGRWLSRDPIGLSGGKNSYSYVSNAPLSQMDQWGLYEVGDKRITYKNFVVLPYALGTPGEFEDKAKKIIEAAEGGDNIETAVGIAGSLIPSDPTMKLAGRGLSAASAAGEGSNGSLKKKTSTTLEQIQKLIVKTGPWFAYTIIKTETYTKGSSFFCFWTFKDEWVADKDPIISEVKSTEGHSYFIIREAAVVAASEALQERAQKYKK